MEHASYPPIADYALIGDCRTAALVSRGGSIDWCCMPRFDSGSVFGRLLDHERGGCCSVAPAVEAVVPFHRRYRDQTLVLETAVEVPGGEALIVDCFTEPEREPSEIVRIVEGRRGAVPIRVLVAPRFDYGEVEPWLRHHGSNVWSATGGDDALVVRGDLPLEAADFTLTGEATVRGGDRLRLSIEFLAPEDVDAETPRPFDAEAIDARVSATERWWRRWSGRARLPGIQSESTLRSAIVIKALTYWKTGAVVAAPTTSLPESLDRGAERNWDYRYSWIRDSVLATRSLAELGYEEEADAFRRFIERSAAGRAEDLQILYGVGGERRLTELDVPCMGGWRGLGPVRVGNRAADQLQLDAYGQIAGQSWRWHQRGHPPDDDDWRFLVDLIEAACERWREPDRGLWEWRGGPKHFVHSKANCWAAVDAGLRLADASMRRAPTRRWRRVREEIRDAIDAEGWDARRRTFRQAFGEKALDAAVLRLPTLGYLAWDDERMVSTVDAVREALDDEGLLRRHDADDALDGREGAFLACTFWLVECLARQERIEEARGALDRAMATANDVGLFAEEHDPGSGEALGNFPQALTHLSQIEAVVALDEALRSSRDGAEGTAAVG